MKRIWTSMGMPISLEIVAEEADAIRGADAVAAYLEEIDQRFSTYKEESEISRLNRGEIDRAHISEEMRTVLAFAEETKQATSGYFDIQEPSGTIDPSGLVKGLAIYAASQLLAARGLQDFSLEAGGDLEARGQGPQGGPWHIGIRNPFAGSEIVKVLALSNRGVATSGSYERGAHIYNPHDSEANLGAVASITVVGANAYEADRFATAAYAMGLAGVEYIEAQPGLEAYQIDSAGIALMTSGFEQYVL